MKRFLLFVVLITVVLFGSRDGFPGDGLQPKEKYHDTVTRKLARGATNFFLGWWEIPQQIHEEYNVRFRREERFRPLVYGPIKGLRKWATRTILGAYEVVTFWFPQQPLMEPEFVLKFEEPDI